MLLEASYIQHSPPGFWKIFLSKLPKYIIQTIRLFRNIHR